MQRTMNAQEQRPSLVRRYAGYFGVALGLANIAVAWLLGRQARGERR